MQVPPPWGRGLWGLYNGGLLLLVPTSCLVASSLIDSLAMSYLHITAGCCVVISKLKIANASR